MFSTADRDTDRLIKESSLTFPVRYMLVHQAFSNVVLLIFAQFLHMPAKDRQYGHLEISIFPSKNLF